MYSRKMAGRMKRALAGLLAAGLVLTGMPTPVVEAANKKLEEPQRPDEGGNASQEGAGETEKPGTDVETDSPGENGNHADVNAPGDGEGVSDADQPGDGENTSDTGQPVDGEGVSDADEPGDGENASDENTPGEEDKEEQNPEDPGADKDTDTSKPGAEDPDGEEKDSDEEKDVTKGDVPAGVSHYNVQVSGNDISGNDLMLYSEEDEEEGTRIVGGYLDLPDEREVSIVDESAPIYNYGDGLAPLMSNSLPGKYVTEKLPKTRDQNPYGSCWAHSAMALAEINMMNFEGASTDVDYSELQLAYFSYKRDVDDPLGGLAGDKNSCADKDFMNRGGNLALAQNVLTSWVGAVDEQTVPYDDAKKVIEEGLLPEFAFNYDVVHLQSYYNVNLKKNRDTAKDLIRQYGGLGTAYYDDSGKREDGSPSPYYNKENACYYYNIERSIEEGKTNHAVTIVGWDDDFSASNFSIRPEEGDGAWLIRNSWSKGQSINNKSIYTYFWMSYYDKNLEDGFAFDFESADNYDNNYQYDGGMQTGDVSFGINKMSVANVFTAAKEGGEQLKAVGIGISKAQTPYIVSVYKNLTDKTDPTSGELVETIKGTSRCEGFYTLRLSKSINLEYGKEFAVVVEFEASEGDTSNVHLSYEQPVNAWYTCTTSAKAGQSLYKTDSYSGWRDFGTKYGGNLRIKAYTVNRNGEQEKVTLQEENVSLETTDFTYNGTAQEPKVVVKVTDTDAALIEGTDYTLSYENNIDAGTAMVTVTGQGDYSGTVTKDFEIKKATVTITAEDVEVLVGDAIPTLFEYKTTGLIGKDPLIDKPTIKCDKTSAVAGVYKDAIVPSGADAGDNYSITYKKGTLTVVDCYTITFDIQEHGTAPAAIEKVRKGNTITEPTTPTAEGYTFGGWYTDAACTKKWNFDTDTVTKNLILYAKWTQKIVTLQGEHVVLTGINLTYNKKEQKPTVKVEVSGKTLFKGTDYELSYENNINAGKATVTVTGKGGYSGEVSKDFEIKKAPLTLQAEDLTIYVGDSFPPEYKYKIITGSLMKGDELTTGYVCAATDSNTEGSYKIELSGTKVGNADEDNYDITCEEGTLTITKNPTVYYKVTFEMQGYGTAPTGYDKIAAGSTISEPTVPTAAGFIFDGWYKDAACTEKWDFGKNKVTENVTLFASWREIVSLKDAVIFLKESGKIVYNGKAQTPKVEIKVSGKALDAGTDYSLSYENNINAGEATVKVTGIGAYKETARKTFEIEKAKITIKAKDVRIKVGDDIPKTFEYDISGLIDGETLKKKPSVVCGITSIDKAGTYAIIPSGAVAGENYTISYENGTLTVVDEYVYYTVTFDVQGHGTGTAPAKLARVRENTLIEKLETDPVEPGFVFDGWYKEPACKTAWNFEMDKVTDHLTLYAKWLVSLKGADVTVQDGGAGFTYNGKAQEPRVTMKLPDGTTLAEEDYTLSYENNINAGTATVTVTGNSGYSGTVSATFEIRKAPLTITAKDIVVKIGETISDYYDFKVEGLVEGEELKTKPTYTCTPANSDEAGEYPEAIGLSGADAGLNYIISYKKGKLTIVDPSVSCTVTFDVQGHGTAPDDTGVKAGDRVTEPKAPEAEGYIFGGWFKDDACTEKWEFEKDKVAKDLTLYAKWETKNAALTEENVFLAVTDFTYDGTEQKPKVVINVPGGTLEEGTDYTLSYENNINAGTAVVTVTGIGICSGTVRKTFEIKKAQLTVLARNKILYMNDPVPDKSEYIYDVNGMMPGDKLLTEPSLTCGITSTAKVGIYDIVISGADAGANYTVSYVNAKLRVLSEFATCRVTFDVQGHGEVWFSYVDVNIGNTVNKPIDPKEEGYRFGGWYRDAAFKQAWDFETDTVQEDMTLYAKWLLLSASDGEERLAIQEIADVYYTGRPCKPAVSVYDGETLLKAGRDYQIKYYNNINANTGGVQKSGNGAGKSFNQALPYVKITGKGNYTETVQVNFNILRAPIGDGGETPAAGVKLTVKDQLVAAARGSLKPFSSIKYRKAMRPNMDYTVSLTPVAAKDLSGGSVTGELSGAVIPAGFSGEFRLTVKGQGNYTGSINKTIYVADKAHLIKNAVITLGANQKNVTFEGKKVELKAAEEASADAFTVKCGGSILKPNEDYTVSYRNNGRVGKAELVITGAGEYTGSKTAVFNIKGAEFSAKTVSVGGIADLVYSGKALTQNDVALTCAGQPLVYGRDYTIIYSKNVNKGIAAMTFKGIEKAGYSGSFKKTFKITAADINQARQAESMQQLEVGYCKAGAKPVEEIVLTDQNGTALKNGKDYTLRYVNNKAVTNAMVIVKGKGNYTGELKVPFRIIEADLRGIAVKTTPVAFKSNKPEDYTYKPAVKLMDGSTALRAGEDYNIEYRNNTQADCQEYVTGDTVRSGALTMDSEVPMVVITEKTGSSYRLEKPIIIPLPVCQTQFKKTELNVVFGDATYTGSQVRPSVTVTYGSVPLVEGKDYTLSYGANMKSGRNQGRVTISGIAPKYGGSITVKFNIERKDITY